MNDTPIVFCHGLLGWKNEGPKGFHYFAAVEKLRKLNNNFPRFIYSSTGPFSSLHDQVCELFFQLKGGLTDYGEEHSKLYGHKRYSRNYVNPEYPQWDSEHPLHFVGHSMGGTLVRLLQYYLDIDYFHNYCGFEGHTSADWVCSLTTIAGVHNGSTLTWILGCDEDSGILEKNARLVRWLARLVEKSGYAQNNQSDKNFTYDLHLDQWNIEKSNQLYRRKCSQIGFDDKDCALYDLTPNSFYEKNSILKEYPDTYYFSCKACASYSIFGSKFIPIPFFAHLILFPNIFAMGFYKVKNEKWKSIEKLFRKNDGMCPTESEGYPFLGRNIVPDFNDFYGDKQKPEKGKWNVIQNLPIMDHAEPAMMPHYLRIKKSMRLYKRLIEIIMNL